MMCCAQLMWFALVSVTAAENEITCTQAQQLAINTSDATIFRSALELTEGEEGYHKIPLHSGLFEYGKILFWASLSLQIVNVLNDGVFEFFADTDETHTIQQKIAKVIIDPNVFSVIATGTSFGMLQGFYANLFAGSPMGVFTVEHAESSASSTVCKRYGVLAVEATNAVSSACYEYQAHREGCYEFNGVHTRTFVSGDPCNGDPLVVQQTLFEGKSGFILKFAFFLGCLLRFCDAIFEFFFQVMKYGFFSGIFEWFSFSKMATFHKGGITNWHHWLKRIIRKMAILRGYKRNYITGLKGGVYDEDSFDPIRLGCGENKFVCDCLPTLPAIIEKLGWGGKCISKLATDCLFGILTMTSLHLSVANGCFHMNTPFSFSGLMLWAYIFTGAVCVGFGMIVTIVIFEMSRAMYFFCKGETVDRKEEKRLHSRILWVFFFTIVLLTILSVAGFMVNTIMLLFVDLPAKGAFGVMFQVFEIIGEFAEAYQDEMDEKDNEAAEMDEKDKEAADHARV